MEQKRFKDCVERIAGFSDEVGASLEGLEMLHDQGENITGKLMDLKSEDRDNLNTWLALLRITITHAQDFNRFVGEQVQEIQTDGFKNLALIQGGAV